MKVQTKKSRFFQAGMTLTESLLALSIAATVSVLVYGGYKMATGMVSANSQINATIQLLGSVKQVFGGGTDYSTVTIANVINSQKVPSEFKVSGTTNIYNAWGGEITPAVGKQSGATPTTFFKLTFTGVPKEQCMDFVSGVAAAAYSVWIPASTTFTAGTHDVKPENGAFDAGRAATRCAAMTSSDSVVIVAN